MPDKHLRSVQQLLHGNGQLSKLHKRVQDLRDVQQKVDSLLENPLNQHLHVAHADPHRLLLHADSAAWATRFRYQKMQFLSQLRQNGWPALSSLDVEVKPFHAGKSKPQEIEEKADVPSPNAVRPISNVAANHLLQLAENSPSPLKEKLLALAARAKKETSR